MCVCVGVCVHVCVCVCGYYVCACYVCIYVHVCILHVGMHVCVCACVGVGNTIWLDLSGEVDLFSLLASSAQSNLRG